MVEGFHLELERELNFNNNDIFNVRWNANGTQLAVGASNGYTHLYNSTYELLNSLNCQSGAEKMPITSLHYRPELEIAKRPVLLVTTCDGGVIHWNLTNAKPLNFSRLRDEQIYSSDFNYDGTKYILGCKEGRIKLFDEETFAEMGAVMHSYDDEVTGAQRVFALKWFDENLFLSGGWDNKLTVWDVRSSTICREFLGPHVCGDSVIIRDNYIISGSYHIKDQIQVWALDSGRNIHTVSLNNNGKKCMPYSVQFCNNQGYRFAVGGHGSDEIYFFDAVNMNQIDILHNVPKTVYSMDLANNKLAIAMGNSVKVYALN